MLGGWIALSLINIDCLYVYFIYRIQRKKQTLTSKIGREYPKVCVNLQTDVR